MSANPKPKRNRRPVNWRTGFCPALMALIITGRSGAIVYAAIYSTVVDAAGILSENALLPQELQGLLVMNNDTQEVATSVVWNEVSQRIEITFPTAQGTGETIMWDDPQHTVRSTLAHYMGPGRWKF